MQILNNAFEFFEIYHKTVELFWGVLCFWIFFDSVSVLQESKHIEQKHHELTERYALLLQLYHKEQKMNLVLSELEAMRQERCKINGLSEAQFHQIQSDLNVMKCILHRKSIQAEKQCRLSRSESPATSSSSPSLTFKIEESTETEDNNSLQGDQVDNDQNKEFQCSRHKNFTNSRNRCFKVIPPLSAE